MADAVLHVEGHLGKTEGETVGHEDGIVAEAFAVAVALGEYLPVDTALKILRLTAFYKAYHCAEVGPAVCPAIEGGKTYQGRIVLEVQ